MQPQPEYQTTSNNDITNTDDGAYLQAMIPHPPSDNHGNVDNGEAPYLELDESAMQPQADYKTTSNNDITNRPTEVGTYLEPIVLHPLSDNHGEYEYVHDPDAVLTDENSYMDLDASAQQPTSVYLEVTNPENLEQLDAYLALDPNSRSAESEYQAIDPLGQDAGPIYDTAI